MTIQEIQALPYREICDKISEIAPQVLAAHARYKELAAEQTAYIAARTLTGAGLTIGEKVWLQYAGQTVPGVVTGSQFEAIYFQALDKKGNPKGKPQAEFSFDGYEKYYDK